MVEDMLEIDGQIQCQHSQDHLEPVGEEDLAEESPLVLSRQMSQRHGENREESPNREGIEADDDEVGTPSSRLGGGERAARRKDFTDSNHKKDAEEKSQAYGCFTGRHVEVLHSPYGVALPLAPVSAGS